MSGARTALAWLAVGVALLLGGVAVLSWRRRHRSWIDDDDLMDLADSLGDPRTRMPAEPSHEARVNGAQVRIPKHPEEV